MCPPFPFKSFASSCVPTDSRWWMHAEVIAGALLCPNQAFLQEVSYRLQSMQMCAWTCHRLSGAARQQLFLYQVLLVQDVA